MNEPKSLEELFHESIQPPRRPRSAFLLGFLMIAILAILPFFTGCASQAQQRQAEAIQHCAGSAMTPYGVVTWGCRQ